MAPNSEHLYTGRKIALASVLVGLVGAIAPVVINMDFTSTAGIVAGLVTLSVVVVKYLEGCQAYEARLDAVAPPGGTPSASELDDAPELPEDHEIDALDGGALLRPDPATP